MRKPPVTDAKFRVVRGPEKLQPWNGIGLPPEWPQWPLVSKIVFVILTAALYIGTPVLVRWFVVTQLVG